MKDKFKIFKDINMKKSISSFKQPKQSKLMRIVLAIIGANLLYAVLVGITIGTSYLLQFINQKWLGIAGSITLLIILVIICYKVLGNYIINSPYESFEDHTKSWEKTKLTGDQYD